MCNMFFKRLLAHRVKIQILKVTFTYSIDQSHQYTCKTLILTLLRYTTLSHRSNSNFNSNFYLLFCPVLSMHMQNTKTHFAALYNFVTSYSIHAPCIYCLFPQKFFIACYPHLNHTLYLLYF